MAHPVPTLFIIGTADTLVPMNGGESTLPWGRRTLGPVSDTLQAWALALGCKPDGRVVSDKGGVKTVEYGSGRNGVDFRACFITGQGHNWPGEKPFSPLRKNEKSVTKVSATDMIWDFFKGHARRKD